MNENENATFQQSEAEKQNPPTEAAEAASVTSWACITSEVGYGDDYSTEVSLDEKLSQIDTALTGKASTTHTHNVSAISGLAAVATSNSYNDLDDQPTIPTIPASLPANGGNADTVDNMHASEFATASHTHSQYAAATHSHSVGEVTGLSDELSGKAASSHTHGQSDITGLATALSGKANSSHTHAQSDITGLTTALSGKASTEHTHNQSDISGLADALAGKAAASHTHTVDSALSSTSTNPVQNKVINSALSGKAAATHTHAISDITGLETALSGKAISSHTHAQSDITGLSTTLSGKANSSHTHAQSDITGLASALSGKASSSHTHAQADITGLSTALSGKANTGHTHLVYHSEQSVSTYKLIYIATNGNDSNTGFSTSVPMATIKGVIKKYADKYKMLDIRLADGTYTENIGTIAIDQCNLSIRSVSEDKDAVTINMATAIEQSITELRMYHMTINVTVTGIRPISVNAGTFYAYGVRFNVPTNSNSSCINVYNGSSAFMLNCIFNSGTGSSTGTCVYGNQATMIKALNCTSERTVATAFHANNGTDIIYTDTITATTVTKETNYGKCTVRTASANTVLWSGNLLMNASHTITPAKKLSECQNGWVLLWSDCDESTGAAQDADFVTTVIPKKKPDGGTWDGKTFHCEVPRYYGSNTSDVDTERRIMKTLYIYNDKIVGHTINDKDERTDVTLRGIYEL